MIILLCGKKRVGKDTVADYLCKKHGFVKYSFADPMKKACKEIFMLDDEQLWGDEKDYIDGKLGISPRKLLQVFGTELFQFDIYNHIPELANKIPPRMLWVKRFEWWYQKNNDKNIVISDGRFLHELEAIKKMGGTPIMVHREVAEKQNNSNHASEKELEEMGEMVNLTIWNDYSIDSLCNQIDYMYDCIYKRQWKI